MSSQTSPRKAHSRPRPRQKEVSEEGTRLRRPTRAVRQIRHLETLLFGIPANPSSPPPPRSVSGTRARSGDLRIALASESREPHSRDTRSGVQSLARYPVHEPSLSLLLGRDAEELAQTSTPNFLHPISEDQKTSEQEKGEGCHVQVQQGQPALRAGHAGAGRPGQRGRHVLRRPGGAHQAQALVPGLRYGRP